MAITVCSYIIFAKLPSGLNTTRQGVYKVDVQMYLADLQMQQTLEMEVLFCHFKIYHYYQ